MIKILIVGDQAILSRGLRMRLSLEADLEVVAEAENASKALEVIPNLKPDLIVLDLEMSKTDGLSNFEIIRGSYLDIPVIMLSIHDWQEDRARAKADGMNAFISDPSELITEIHRVVNQRYR